MDAYKIKCLRLVVASTGFETVTFAYVGSLNRELILSAGPKSLTLSYDKFLERVT